MTVVDRDRPRSARKARQIERQIWPHQLRYLLYLDTQMLKLCQVERLRDTESRQKTCSESRMHRLRFWTKYVVKVM